MGVLSYTPLPLVPWMGGKRRLAKHLLPLFPEHQCYVELFAGGGALFFMRPQAAKTEVLNDINSELVNLYRVAQCHFDEFIRQFDCVLTSRETFVRLQSAPPELMTDIQRAARFFFLQHTAFGGKTIDQHFGTATTGKAFNAANIRNKLQAAHTRLGGVYVENEPWQSCLKRYDRPHTFFYADPPYWQTARYQHGFEWHQYEQLAESMTKVQGKVMLSINNHPDIVALFKDFWIKELKLQYSISREKSNQRAAGELVICNYIPSEQ